MKDILLFPFNGNAIEALSVIRDINKQEEQWNVLGFIDDDVEKHGASIDGCVVLGGREQLRKYPYAQLLAVPGRPENFTHRREIIESFFLKPEQYATIVHPSARIGVECSLGKNVLVMANVVLTARVTVADHIVILPNSVIAHGTAVDSYSLIGSNVSISGEVHVGRNCYIGSGSRIIQDVSIGEQSLIGLGAVIIENVFPKTVMVGNPAVNLKVS